MKSCSMFHGVRSTIVGASCIYVQGNAEYSTDEKVYGNDLRGWKNLPTIMIEKERPRS